MVWSKNIFSWVKTTILQLHNDYLSVKREVRMMRVKEGWREGGYRRDRETERNQCLRMGIGPVFLPNFSKTRAGPL